MLDPNTFRDMFWVASTPAFMRESSAGTEGRHASSAGVVIITLCEDHYREMSVTSCRCGNARDRHRVLAAIWKLKLFSSAPD